MASVICDPAGPAPLRRTHSVRRTSSLDVDWPNGRDTPSRVVGRCRDLVTGGEFGDVDIAREDVITAALGGDRVIHAVENDRLDLSVLIGVKGGGHLRAVLDAEVHEERTAGSPLYLLLDDISGVSLVSGWAWSRWDGALSEQSGFEQRRMTMENVCWGFATGSSALSDVRPPRNNPPVVALANPEDPHSWHALPEAEGAGFRRARRIDVWLEGSSIIADVGFQDSATDPDSGRVAIHEYSVVAKADVQSQVLDDISATPHILPFPECPGAVGNTRHMVGTPLQEMRTQVIETLPGNKGCTHLNDLLRGLAEVPVLVELLGKSDNEGI